LLFDYPGGFLFPPPGATTLTFYRREKSTLQIVVVLVVDAVQIAKVAFG
jgi:hypothetical protein